MFTGIVEERGRILKLVRGRTGKLSIGSALDCRIGDSVAVNGVCLTVSSLFKAGLNFEAMGRTMRSTTMDRWRTGDLVNLERGLKVGDRLGGHFVLGHVDEAVKLIRTAGNEYFFQAGAGYQRYLVPKGSVCLDGVSLTVSRVSRNIFSVSLILHTLKATTFQTLKPGSFVNAEYDYLLKANVK